MRALIYTLGYEGLDIQTFITLVRDEGISCVVDLRWTPWSRKSGFSKTALHQLLAANGIDYVPMPSLGSPRELRQRLYQTRDWRTFADRYTMLLQQQGDALAAIGRMASRMTVGLLCFEANARRCHRSLVMEALASVAGEEFQWRDLSKDGLKTLGCSLR